MKTLTKIKYTILSINLISGSLFFGIIYPFSEAFNVIRYIYFTTLLIWLITAYLIWDIQDEIKKRGG
jgi:hypothetical protein